MKLAKAIEILENYPVGASPDDSIELNAAIQLSIEAMKFIKSSRTGDPGWVSLLLPGETEE